MAKLIGFGILFCICSLTTAQRDTPAPTPTDAPTVSTNRTCVSVPTDMPTVPPPSPIFPKEMAREERVLPAAQQRNAFEAHPASKSAICQVASPFLLSVSVFSVKLLSRFYYR